MSEGTPPPPPPANPYQQNQPMSPSDQKLWATLIHIGGAIFNFLPALIGYLVLKDRGDFIRGHSATALNFQLTVLIAYIATYILMLISFGILFFLPLAVWVVNIVFCIIAAITANKVEPYVYPLAINFVS